MLTCHSFFWTAKCFHLYIIQFKIISIEFLCMFCTRLNLKWSTVFNWVDAQIQSFTSRTHLLWPLFLLNHTEKKKTTRFKYLISDAIEFHYQFRRLQESKCTNHFLTLDSICMRNIEHIKSICDFTFIYTCFFFFDI